MLVNALEISSAAGESRPPLFALEAMGTRFELLLPALHERHARPIAEAALDIIREWHDALNAFSPASFVGRFNRSTPGEWLHIDNDLWTFLRYCHSVWTASAGAFDPALGARMHDLGLRSMKPAASLSPPAPSRASWGFSHLAWNPDHLAVARTIPIELDFGSVAKGWAIDRALDELKTLGITEALIHGGTSTVAAIGDGPSGTGWHVHVIPDLDGPIITLRNSAMSISSPRGRLSDHGHHHVIDPRTGESARCARWAICEATSAADSDAWSTVALVSGCSLGTTAQTIPTGVSIRLDKHEWTSALPTQTLRSGV